ncbi:MAG: PTS sugar transporter subunit IIA [Sandaracinus sp.]
MRLSQILTLERIDTHLDASDKADVLRALSRLIAREPAFAPTPSGEQAPVTIERVLEERERLASTGIGDGVAIPHGRIAGLDHFVAALAIRREGVPFDAIDGHPASIFFALVGPERAAGEHLKCLARIGRVLRDDAVRSRILAASEPADVLAIVTSAEGP